MRWASLRFAPVRLRFHKIGIMNDQLQQDVLKRGSAFVRSTPFLGLSFLHLFQTSTALLQNRQLFLICHCCSSPCSTNPKSLPPLGGLVRIKSLIPAKLFDVKVYSSGNETFRVSISCNKQAYKKPNPAQGPARSCVDSSAACHFEKSRMLHFIRWAFPETSAMLFEI